MTILARGIYRYRKDGDLQNIVEPWHFAQTPDGLTLTSERRVADNVVLQVQARFSGSTCTGMQARWNAAHSCVYDYQLEAVAPDEQLLYWQAGNDGNDAQLPGTLKLAGDALLFPLMRAAAGPLVLALAQKPHPVVVPSLHHPEDPTFLHPRVSQRHAEQQDAQHFRYYGGEYGSAGSDYWLHPSGLLQAYRWDSPTGVWEVELDKLVRDPAFSGFA